jgi:tRNA-specific 2-thiouridylase
MCEFPIGAWQKDDVRAEAQRRGLPNWDRPSTSGVCFLGTMNIGAFLASRAPVTPATVVTTAGERVGSVDAAEALTVGQRVGIAGQSKARYVIATNPAAGRVVVSAADDDPARSTRVVHTHAPNWIGSPPALPRQMEARIRHRQEPRACAVEANGVGALRVTLGEPLIGVAPGQAVVLTEATRVLGGAVITDTGA